MTSETTIVLDLRSSAARIERYWEALRRGALSALSAAYSDAPVRSYLWPHVRYAQGPLDRFTESQLRCWIEKEQEAFAGVPMSDPKAFLEDLAAVPMKGFEYLPSRDVSPALNAKLSEALRIIEAAWPDASKELQSAVLGVAWIASPDARVESASDPKRFGVVHLNANYFEGASAYKLATALIHEVSHHSLFVETASDPLIPEDFAVPVYSALRREMRPAIGVLHGAFSLARRGLWGQRLADHSFEGASEEARRIHREYVALLPGALESLKVIRFSTRGQRLFGELQNLLAPLESPHD